jgi:hypothetical protein
MAGPAHDPRARLWIETTGGKASQPLPDDPERVLAIIAEFAAVVPHEATWWIEPAKT